MSLIFDCCLIDANVIKLCDDSFAELIGNYTEHLNPKLAAWCLNIERPCMFAVSFPNHRIQLIKQEMNFYFF